jgi:hypothetical protein
VRIQSHVTSCYQIQVGVVRRYLEEQQAEKERADAKAIIDKAAERTGGAS